MGSTRVTRRALLGAAGMAGAAGSAGALAGELPAAHASPTLDADPFRVGVASGDVTSDAVVLWTRLTTAPTEPGLGMDGQGVVPVEWRLAESPEGLASPATSLRVGVAAARPEHCWSVHVDVRGLRPGRTFWYEFRIPGWSSGVARTRTAPADGTASTADFAVVSCQNLAKPGSGRFHLNGVRDIAARDDLDFVVHLGDYIYDFGRAGHIPARQIVSLEDYRRRYGQYKSDPNLRAMHAAHPVFAVPDDHEFFDNVFGGDPDMDPEKRAQLSIALRAYWENMPLRGGPPRVDPVTSIPHLRIHRQVRWGSSLELFLVDDRQYRVPATTILGAEQMRWLVDGLASSAATWTAVGSGVPLAWFPSFAGAGDKWTGYDTDRSAVTDVLADRLADRAEQPFNPVVLSGDVHRGMVTHVRRRQDATSALVATEFVGPPMTSNSGNRFTETADTGAFRAEYSYGTAPVSSYRGYLACSVTPESWTSTYVVGDDVDTPTGVVRPIDSWRLIAGADPGSVTRV